MINHEIDKINKILNSFDFSDMFKVEQGQETYDLRKNNNLELDSAEYDFGLNSSETLNNFSNLGSKFFDVYKVREDFPILQRKIHGKPLIWFDNGATAQKPKAVINAISNYYSMYNSNVHRGVHTLSQEASELFDQARKDVAKFINASSASEIIFTKGATEGFNLIAQTIGKDHIQEGDDILITRLEHHSNILPWKRLAKEKKANLKIIPIDSNGDIMLGAFSNMLGPKTKIVSLTHVANAIGTLVPVQTMVQQAKSVGAITIVDGAQSIPHMAIDVQELGCDFFVFSGHKMFAPTGTGVIFARDGILSGIPYQVGGGMIHNVTDTNVEYAPAPYMYEAGTGNLADIEGLRMAIHYLQKLDMNVIEQYEHELVEYAYNQMKHFDHINFIGNPTNRVGVLSFTINNMDNDEVGKILNKEGIAVRTGHHCAQPLLSFFGVKGTIRASLAFYNTYEEVDKMVKILQYIR